VGAIYSRTIVSARTQCRSQEGASQTLNQQFLNGIIFSSKELLILKLISLFANFTTTHSLRMLACKSIEQHRDGNYAFNLNDPHFRRLFQILSPCEISSRLVVQRASQRPQGALTPADWKQRKEGQGGRRRVQICA
jgi:hypothetical protein